MKMAKHVPVEQKNGQFSENGGSSSIEDIVIPGNHSKQVSRIQM